MLDRSNLAHTLLGVLAFVGVIWGVFLLDVVLPIQEWLGLVPRDIQGLSGIIAMTFLHVDLPHLIANTVPLFLLLILLAVSDPHPWYTTAAVAVFGGVLLWLFGRNGEPGLVQVHIGASLLIYGLVTYLIARGLFRREPIPLTIAVIVGVLYGGSTLMSVLPIGENASWDGHLAGAVAGFAIGYLQRKRS